MTKSKAKSAVVRMHAPNFANGLSWTFWSVTLKVGPGRYDVEVIEKDFDTEVDAIKAAKAAGAKTIHHV